jgi:hypothetical protein
MVRSSMSATAVWTRPRAIDWYRDHDRPYCGDAVTMAADALAGYQADIAAGKDSLLVCDTREAADALNQRLHTETPMPTWRS